MKKFLTVMKGLLYYCLMIAALIALSLIFNSCQLINNLSDYVDNPKSLGLLILIILMIIAFVGAIGLGIATLTDHQLRKSK